MRITLLVLMLSFGLISAALGQQISAAVQEMMKIRQSMTQQFAADVAKKDATALADHYTAEAVTASRCPETPPVVGRDAQIKRFEAGLKAGFRDYVGKI